MATTKQATTKQATTKQATKAVEVKPKDTSPVLKKQFIEGKKIAEAELQEDRVIITDIQGTVYNRSIEDYKKL